MGQYKHNIKEQSTIIELCAMRQGGNETLDKYIPLFKKVWQSIRSKLDDNEICAIFRDSIVPLLNLHSPSNKNVSFVVLVQELLQKEKVLLALGELKYTPNPFNKDNWRTYAKK